MNHSDFDSEIDRALGDEHTISVSSDFTARVMRSIRLEADEKQAIAFPWRRLCLGWGILVLLVLLEVAFSLLTTGGSLGRADVLALRPELMVTIQWVLTSFAISYFFVWWSSRLGRYQS